MSHSTRKNPPLIAHIIHRLAIGGLENGLVNLINHMPTNRYRHAIICMTEYTDFSQRIQHDDVTLHALHKREGNDFSIHRRLWQLLRQLRPAIVHTRNLATLEMQTTAAFAGVRHRVHGEHGWDIGDLDGSSIKQRRLRQLFRPFISQYVVLSQHQRDYLLKNIGVPATRINSICNGVNTQLFYPTSAAHISAPPNGFAPPGTLVIGTVMRMQPVKAPEMLVDSFIQLLAQEPTARERIRLVMIGDGALLPMLRERLTAAGVMNLAWLPGARDDIPNLLRSFDVFVLPSLAEGICNTILEAMASGLPVIATRVGGNPELVIAGETGDLIAPANVNELTAILAAYLHSPARIQKEGQAARHRAEQEFSLDTMVGRYLAVYDKLLTH
ncbi:TIGR03088 family PEP-CTERM/XrtA system glycosyltransferase [Chromatium okenii]|uniref:TIGR03088 family PEP-CTERM/XrtA system glycosyltransferase n=1 Tax=Chromatium okenii TaxID=61644 RepID=UPI0026EB1C2F|nr:TIGR03088 family PEP-CTERM/XrtA system glycosyltransferase [Chromatium okenii]MBV5308075.1 TIGR03088 family PEP-CTERM/XrtA system glycosyltransferase [Chromatium okenii]